MSQDVKTEEYGHRRSLIAFVPQADLKTLPQFGRPFIAHLRPDQSHRQSITWPHAMNFQSIYQERADDVGGELSGLDTFCH
jgi:hypothetical protein